jgi:glycosyltransferase involved in cell wall biosynthesis
MQEQLLLSIIVPVYNVEKVLRKCVESLEKQDMSHDRYEVILVNDGSTDRSGAICHELAALYENIQVIEQENQGLSMARNAGLDIARLNILCSLTLTTT